MRAEIRIGTAVLVAAALYAVDRFILMGLTRQGLIAGIAVGLVFGATTPAAKDPGTAGWLAVRTGLAFGLVTGLGFGFYKGMDPGIAWAIGGTLGVAGGDFVGLLFRLPKSERR